MQIRNKSHINEQAQQVQQELQQNAKFCCSPQCAEQIWAGIKQQLHLSICENPLEGLIDLASLQDEA